VQIFYADQEQCDEWDRQMMDGLDELGQQKLRAAPPESWRTQPGFYYSLEIEGKTCTEGPFATYDECYAELQNTLANLRAHKPPARLQ
jgi:hypothetical protein